MSVSFTPPFYGGATTVESQSPPYASAVSTPPTSDSYSSTSIIIVIIVIASAVIVTASIYLLLRFLSKRFHRSFRTFSTDDVVSRQLNTNIHVAAENSLLDSLPLFTFRSVASGNLNGGDCAVCLSRFEPHDQLRLLPLCCHAFHAECIDTWILANQTCPLCRSTVAPSDRDVLDKILQSENNNNRNNNNSVRDGNNNNNSGSFRIEIGSVSRRRGEAATAETGGNQRSYSLGSFDYIMDDNGYEISLGSIHSRGNSECTSMDKESSINIPVPDSAGEALAAEVGGGGGRNWLREYVDRLSSVSFSSSFRSSGRFFTGSSRRTEPVIAADDLEANRVGEEITELFRWLSGV